MVGIGKVVGLAVVLLVKLPVAILAYLAFNLARIVAPGLLINAMKGKAKEGGNGKMGKMMESIQSTEDFGFMFSLDKVKVILRNMMEVPNKWWIMEFMEFSILYFAHSCPR